MLVVSATHKCRNNAMIYFTVFNLIILYQPVTFAFYPIGPSNWIKINLYKPATLTGVLK